MNSQHNSYYPQGGSSMQSPGGGTSQRGFPKSGGFTPQSNSNGYQTHTNSNPNLRGKKGFVTGRAQTPLHPLQSQLSYNPARFDETASQGRSDKYSSVDAMKRSFIPTSGSRDLFPDEPRSPTTRAEPSPFHLPGAKDELDTRSFAEMIKKRMTQVPGPRRPPLIPIFGKVRDRTDQEVWSQQNQHKQTHPSKLIFATPNAPERLNSLSNQATDITPSPPPAPTHSKKNSLIIPEAPKRATVQSLFC
eukprot:TRINITY_DN1967_c0_g1_i1.p1 TRINITY_DN1967_c0_g1~~TRINITY_DN1967_c0_g1_i1.p1  ORF type:complete len:247 (-),score=24.46 TRINITY_DN1967_c0_g1_i1:163-903(-)